MGWSYARKTIEIYVCVSFHGHYTRLYTSVGVAEEKSQQRHQLFSPCVSLVGCFIISFTYGWIAWNAKNTVLIYAKLHLTKCSWERREVFFFWWTELVPWWRRRPCDQLLSLAAGKATFFSREIDKGMVNVSSSPNQLFGISCTWPWAITSREVWKTQCRGEFLCFFYCLSMCSTLSSIDFESFSF